MRHSNPNMVPAVLAGIEAGEHAVSIPGGEAMYRSQLAVIVEVTPQLVPRGDRPFVTSGLLKAKAIAFAQGFIAAYRSA